MTVIASKSSSRAWRQLRHDRVAIVGATIVLVLLVLGLFGPWMLGASAEAGISADVLAPPSSTHLLGTDDVGRSTSIELLLGVRTSLAVGLVSAMSSTVLGLIVGVLAGYFGGWFDSVMMRVSEVFQVMPTFVLAAVVVALAGPGTFRVIGVIAILSWPQAARLARGEVMRIKNLEYVDAARCMGERHWQILLGAVLPNAVAPVLALGTLVIGQAILLEAGLSFFGLTTPDTPSWGSMLHVGQRFVFQAWWLSVFPGVAILITVLAFNLLGDSLSSAFNPRSGVRA